jgi:hypothetical protein
VCPSALTPSHLACYAQCMAITPTPQPERKKLYNRLPLSLWKEIQHLKIEQALTFDVIVEKALRDYVAKYGALATEST